MSERARQRSGVVLIIVVGIASIIITMAVAFMAWMRSDGEQANVAVREAQSRLMLHAGLMLVQEQSRIGWSDAEREGGAGATFSTYGYRENAPTTKITGVPDHGGDAYGWTDIRNGWLGPLGPRDADHEATTSNTSAIPAPRWWTRYQSTPSPTPTGWPSTAWPDYSPVPDENDGSEFPAPKDRRWPLPGSALRAPMGVPTVAPYAVRLDVGYNVPSWPVSYDDPNWDDRWEEAGKDSFTRDWGNDLLGPTAWYRTGFRPYDLSQGATGSLDPQPVYDTFAEFAAGDRSPLHGDAQYHYVPEQRWYLQPGSEHLAWFRVYRELQEDHDADEQAVRYTSSGASAVSWSFDSVALHDPVNAPELKNWNVFVISCGAGGTHGFRFWELSDSDPRRALEPVTASESGLFPPGEAGRELFAILQQSERVTWYRVEWSGQRGGVFDPYVYYGRRNRYIDQHSRLDDGYGDKAGLRGQAMATHGGHFKWIQRLDREPPNW